MLLLAQAKAVYQVQKEEALKLIWQKHTHTKTGEKVSAYFCQNIHLKNLIFLLSLPSNFLS